MNGIELIAAERQRQIDTEGWTALHDDGHKQGEMAAAAICYAAPTPVFRIRELSRGFQFTDPWPWDEEWDKRRYDRTGMLLLAENYKTPQRIRNLAKAGALIAAEIDRLQRTLP